MDDAFRIVASRMPRTRRLSPFDVRLLVWSLAALMLVAAFGGFVMSHQRAADVRRAAGLAAQRAAAVDRAEAAAAAAIDTSPEADPRAVTDLLDRQAQDAATAALTAATHVAASRGLPAATIDALRTAAPDLLFVDGPSTSPSVVSVYVGDGGWAAAVHGADDTCYWVARSAAGRDRFGTGAACTGEAALAADAAAW